MKHGIRAPIVASMAAALLFVNTTGAFAAEGKAAEGKILIFETKASDIAVFDNPQGCTGLPLAAHVLISLTNTKINIFAGPGCLVPAYSVEPGRGWHVSPGGPFTGSFSP